VNYCIIPHAFNKELIILNIHQTRHYIIVRCCLKVNVYVRGEIKYKHIVVNNWFIYMCILYALFLQILQFLSSYIVNESAAELQLQFNEPLETANSLSF